MKIKDEYRLTSFGEFLKQLKDPDISKIHDFTDNGKCRNCGNCCGNYIPLTFDDFRRIKHYIKEHGIKPSRPRIAKGPFAKPTVHNLCPFLLEKDEDRCAIYPVRPDICRMWTCHNPKNDMELKKWYFGVRYIKTVDMYMMFYPEQTLNELEQIKEVI